MGQTADELALVDAAREEYASQTLVREEEYQYQLKCKEESKEN